MDLDPLVRTPAEERLLALASAIKEYEDKNFFFEKPTAEEHKAFLKEQQLHNK